MWGKKTFEIFFMKEKIFPEKLSQVFTKKSFFLNLSFSELRRKIYHIRSMNENISNETKKVQKYFTEPQ